MSDLGESVNPEREEKWRDITGYEGRYQVSDHGRVRSLTSVHILGRSEPRLMKGHYLSLVFKGKRSSRFVHRLVLEAFVGPCPDGMEALHGNGNRLDNRLCNLRWGTPKENGLDKIRHKKEGRKNVRHVQLPSAKALLSESWRPVLGYEGRYEVSSLGQVRSICWNNGTAARHGLAENRSTRLKKQWYNNTGYPTTNLTKDGKQRTVCTHVLVLEAFTGPRPPGLVACHNDGNKTNNRSINLRWGTPAANNADNVTFGHGVGERAWNTKLTEADVVQIRESKELTGDIAKRYGIAPDLVWKIRVGKTWTHAGGPIWDEVPFQLKPGASGHPGVQPSGYGGWRVLIESGDRKKGTRKTHYGGSFDDLATAVDMAKALKKHLTEGAPDPRLLPKSNAGENNNSAKLTEEKVEEIRSSGLPVRELAAKYDVTKNCIRLILKGKTWVKRP